jgi:biopolymer transport protein ExbD
MLIRLGTDGLPSVRGQSLSLDQLHALLKSQLAETPLMQVIILPLGGANMQTLVSVMEQVTRAGGQRLRVVRLEARP